VFINLNKLVKGKPPHGSIATLTTATTGGWKCIWSMEQSDTKIWASNGPTDYTYSNAYRLMTKPNRHSFVCAVASNHIFKTVNKIYNQLSITPLELLTQK
jgi:hypothetical protein